MSDSASAVRAAGAADFDASVVERSRTLPVVVDFWAAWCGPCRTVAPILERLADEFRDRAEVVKVDTDAEPAIAARFGVRSLPTLAVFRGGALADALVGAQPEALIRALIDRHLDRPADREREEALARARSGDVDGAVASLEQLAASEPERPEALLALIDVLIDAGRLEAAAARIAHVPLAFAGAAPFVRAAARLELARAADSGDGARGAGARAFRDGHPAEAIEAWLAALQMPPRDAALAAAIRAAFVVLGDDHELVVQARRRMASLLH